MIVTLDRRTAETVKIYFEHSQSPEIRRFLPQKAQTVEEALADYKQTLLPGARSFGQTIRANGVYAGDVWCYCIQPGQEPSCMLSYCVFPEHWGGGIATRAVAQFIERICSMYPIETIGALTFADNIASARVLEKNQFVLVETMVENGIASLYFQRSCRCVHE